MTVLFALHSAYGLTTAAAGIDEGLFEGRGERVLVPFNSARVPETTIGLDAHPHLTSLRARFDRIESLDALLQPRHPSSWEPDEDELPVLRRLLERAWSLDDDLELCVQSPQVAPARTLMSLFPNARLTIIGDGLMTYSPIRVELPRSVVARIGRVVYADVVPGVEPLVFREAGAERMPVLAARFAAALAETGGDDPALDALADGTPTALVLGQYFAALGLVGPDEEIGMQRQMIDRALAWSPARIVFKPHPSAPPALTDAVRAHAESHGLDFVVYRGHVPAEIVAERVDAVGVVAGFSTALPTIRALYDRPIAAVGTGTMLRRLSPYENSNRVPATIVDALTRAGSTYAESAQLQLLVDAVGYAMQPKIAAHLRPRAEQLLRAMTREDRDRYFDPARLARLQLPGAPRESMPRRVLRSAGGVGRVEELRLTVDGVRRRAARAWKVVRGL
ncbi:polysialyltransferase family glycosyltransferase [Microbacterium abyssi]|uniref:polysialyltransferase family glycosyltransferase n=1 Tax=Microbacterium abyssi TaxID=2782166 RepID=UPI001887EB17|nr:polysialyltransferase family glycosyltransferase [Microbacterium sp. A18JL241]